MNADNTLLVIPCHDTESSDFKKTLDTDFASIRDADCLLNPLRRHDRTGLIGVHLRLSAVKNVFE